MSKSSWPVERASGTSTEWPNGKALANRTELKYGGDREMEVLIHILKHVTNEGLTLNQACEVLDLAKVELGNKSLR